MVEGNATLQHNTEEKRVSIQNEVQNMKDKGENKEERPLESSKMNATSADLTNQADISLQPEVENTEGNGGGSMTLEPDTVCNTTKALASSSKGAERVVFDTLPMFLSPLPIASSAKGEPGIFKVPSHPSKQGSTLKTLECKEEVPFRRDGQGNC